MIFFGLPFTGISASSAAGDASTASKDAGVASSSCKDTDGAADEDLAPNLLLLLMPDVFGVVSRASKDAEGVITTSADAGGASIISTDAEIASTATADAEGASTTSKDIEIASTSSTDAEDTFTASKDALEGGCASQLFNMPASFLYFLCTLGCLGFLEGCVGAVRGLGVIVVDAVRLGDESSNVLDEGVETVVAMGGVIVVDAVRLGDESCNVLDEGVETVVAVVGVSGVDAVNMCVV